MPSQRRHRIRPRTGRGTGHTGRSNPRAPLAPAPLAHIVYALCGHGRGHASRAAAVAQALRQRGHRVRFAAGDPAAGRLAGEAGAEVYRVPALRQVMRGNRVRMLATARANLALTWRSPEIIDGAAGWLETAGADLVVSDHEPFVARAARRVGVPVVALSHQLVLTETRPRVPLRHVPSYWTTVAGLDILAPPRPDGVVVPSFFFPPRRAGSRAVLVPPVLCDDVLALRATTGGRVLVYVNEGDGMEAFVRALGRADAAFDVYGLPPGGPAPSNVRLRAPSRRTFLADLAAARAVVSTAGFTLLSEALHLGKPVLALPNRGFFEQVVNALALVDAGRGEAVVGRPLRDRDLRRFLARADHYRQPPQGARAGRSGRERAADAIEALLADAPPAHTSIAA